MMRPGFAWSIVLVGLVLGVGGGAGIGVLLRSERVVTADMIVPPPSYRPGRTIDIPMNDEVGTAHLLGSWTRDENGIVAFRIDPTRPQPPIDDRFAHGFTEAFVRRFPPEDVHQKKNIDQLAGRRVAHVDLDIDGHSQGDVRVRCAGMLIGARVVSLVAFHGPDAADADRAFDRMVENVATLSDREPVQGAVVARAAGFGAGAFTFPALMLAVFVTQRRRDTWQRTRARKLAKVAAS